MTYTIYVIALTISLMGLLVDIVFCLIDAKTYKKLEQRVKALEGENKK